MVIKSITADTTIPEPLQSWYDAMIEYIDEHSVTIDEVDQLVEDYLEEHPVQAPVQSVNTMTGDVVITAADLGAITTETDPVFVASAAYGISSSDITAWNGKYTKPASGIPATDLTSTVQSRLLKTGGTTGQVLAKASGTNYDVAWTTVSGGGAVDSVNGQTGTVVLDADDVGALPDTYTAPVTSVNTKTGAVTLTASDVGALSSSTTFVSSFNGNTGAVTYTAPVTSVNTKTGAASLSASDVGALPDTYTAPVTSVNTRTGAVTGLAEAVTVENKTSADTSLTLTAGKFYVFPTMSSLAVTVTATGLYMFRFQSGSTPTSLTVTGATMPDSFTVEANKIYEVSIYQGYGVVSAWTAS